VDGIAEMSRTRRTGAEARNQLPDLLEAAEKGRLTTDIAESAARVRASFRMKFPDAVQVASALTINADALVTHDRDFSNMRSLRIIS
jgi:predicted nucleic acid-binding protein